MSNSTPIFEPANRGERRTAGFRITGRPTIDPVGWDRRVRDVRFICPACGDERPGGVYTDPDGGIRVDCEGCTRSFDTGVLDIPTVATLGQWYTAAIRHARSILRETPGRERSDLAIAWCRRLAPELSRSGKVMFLDALSSPLQGRITDAHRRTLVDLGAALGMSTADLNRYLLSI